MTNTTTAATTTTWTVEMALHEDAQNARLLKLKAKIAAHLGETLEQYLARKERQMRASLEA